MSEPCRIKATIVRPCNMTPYVRVWILPNHNQHQSQSDEDHRPPRYYEVEQPDGLEGTDLSPSPEWLAGFLAGIQTKDEHSHQKLGFAEKRPPGIRMAQTLDHWVSKVLKPVRFQDAPGQGRFLSSILTPVGCFATPMVAEPGVAVMGTSGEGQSQ